MRVAEAIESLATQLRAIGMESERREARLILGAALAVGQESLIGHPERILAASELANVDALLRRRLAHEPLSRITGIREFWSMPFGVTQATLDPRPDSETVIEATLDCVADRAQPLAILDLGTGTGCLLLALLAELPSATGVGIDCDAAAVATARRNAEHLGLADRATFVEGHWGRGQVEHYNLIVSNPPYIRTTDLDSLPRNVIGYDPVLALDGGADGLDCFRALAPDAARLLESGGTLIVEIGVGQESAVEAILMQETLVPVARRRDLGGRVRCISARKSHSI